MTALAGDADESRRFRILHQVADMGSGDAESIGWLRHRVSLRSDQPNPLSFSTASESVVPLRV